MTRSAFKFTIPGTAVLAILLRVVEGAREHLYTVIKTEDSYHTAPASIQSYSSEGGLLRALVLQGNGPHDYDDVEVFSRDSMDWDPARSEIAEVAGWFEGGALAALPWAPADVVQREGDAELFALRTGDQIESAD